MNGDKGSGFRVQGSDWARVHLVIFLIPFVAAAQEPSASRPATEEETIVPTFETQKLARTYILDIPAPRGQITDRHGVPLAQTRKD